MINGYYTGCVKSGNIGDDILFYIFLEMLANEISEKYNIKCTIHEDTLFENEKWNLWINNSSLGVTGGGSLLHPEEISYTIPIENYKNIVKNTFIFGTGISDSPKYKISELDRKKIINKNYNINFPINDCVKFNLTATHNANFGGLRGPLDVAIAKSFIPNFNKTYIYDAGILANKYIKFNKIDKKIKKDIVGINLADVTGNNRISLINESYSEYMNRFKKIIIEYCNFLLSEGYHLYFYSMSAGEMELNKSIINLLNDSSNISTHDSPLSFSDLLSISNNFKFAIATRLHANILVNSNLIPTINLSYNCKAINYMHSIDIEECIIPTNEIMNIKNLKNTHFNLIKNYDFIKSKLYFHKERANNLYKKEFKKILNNLIINNDNNSEIIIKYQIYNFCLALFQII